MALSYPYREPRTQESTPYLLSTGATPLSVGVDVNLFPTAPAVIPTLAMINTLRQPVEVTELIFVLSALGNGSGTEGVEVSLAIGKHQITRDWAPVRSLAVRRDSAASEGAENVAVWVEGNALFSDTIRWIFPKPLIVAPNEGFSGMFRLSPVLAPYFSLTTTVDVIMVARGRRLASGTPVPSTRAIPYASGWIFDTPNTPAPDLVFRNNLGTTLHVSSLNAINAYLSPVNSSYMSFPGTLIANSPGGLDEEVRRSVITPVPQNAASIFGERCAIEEPHDLAPNESYTISLTGQPAIFAVQMTMIGWREE